MNKSQLLKGITAGKPLVFHMPYTQYYEQVPYIQEQFKQLEAAAEQDGGIPELSYEKFKLYWATGDREIYQEVYYEKRKQLLMYSLLLWRSPDHPRYKETLENILWSICSEPMWALPAHFTNRYGDLPLEAYDTLIDLFAAETGFALAEALRLCEPYIDKKCAAYVRLQLHKRMIIPFLDGNTFFRFETMPNNWSAVCGGALGCVGMLVLEDEEKLTNFLHRVVSCMEVYLESFGADGVCVEGVDYWTYGFGFFVCFADYLKVRTGGRIDLFNDEKVKQIALNQQVYYLANNYTISFADGRGVGSYRLGLGMYLKRCYPEVVLPDMMYAQNVLEDSCYRFCLALRDMIWYDPDFQWTQEKKQSQWLNEAQWFVSHGESLILVAKGGHNGESHNHNDCGSFILYKNGVPMLEDLGAGIYTAVYFSDKRYEIFVNRSGSHNVPMVDGLEQCAGEAYRAEIVEVSFGDSDTFGVELKACYPTVQLMTLQRSLRHDKAKGCILLEDVARFNGVGTVSERFVSHSPILIEGRSAIIRNGGEVLRLTFDEDDILKVLQESYETHKGDIRIAYILEVTKYGSTSHISYHITME
ncbi:MAG: heparinase II/III domain-containing protein [Cellulosilyticaceae bacterium]